MNSVQCKSIITILQEARILVGKGCGLIQAVHRASPNNMGSALLALDTVRTVNHIQSLPSWSKNSKTSIREIINAIELSIATLKEPQ